MTDTPISEQLNVDGDSANYVSLSVAALFAVHPIQTQAVTYIVQRFTSLATLFYLMSILLYVQWRIKYSDLRKPIPYILSLISLILAMRTKEISFTLPLIIFLYDVIFIRDSMKNRLLYFSPFMLCLSIIPLTIIATIGGQAGFNASNHINISSLHYFFTQSTAIIKYIGLLIIPTNQALDYNYPLYSSISNIYVITSILAIIFLLLISIYWIFYKAKDFIWKVIGFGILWFFITLSVESSIIPI